MTAAAIARAIRLANQQALRLACATCGDRCAPFACAWPCDVPKWCAALVIDVGDIVISPQSRRECRVTHVNLLHHAYSERAIFQVDITVEYRHGRRKPPYPHFTYERKPLAQVQVLRPGACGARCCEAHVREVSEGRHYCRAHWRAWMEVGAA